jgi:hypothetical protein
MGCPLKKGISLLLSNTPAHCNNKVGFFGLHSGKATQETVYFVFGLFADGTSVNQDQISFFQMFSGRVVHRRQ